MTIDYGGWNNDYQEVVVSGDAEVVDNYENSEGEVIKKIVLPSEVEVREDFPSNELKEVDMLEDVYIKDNFPKSELKDIGIPNDIEERFGK